MATTMAPAQGPSGWSLIWSDEFNQADGTLPDPTKWNYDVGGWGWGNNEIQYYTERPQNARVLSGMLLIEARRETFGGRNHTSARLLTKGKHQWTYGRFEARIKVPRGAGLWPAFWMLGSEIDQVGWPNCGEIDIMEHVGRLPDEVFGTVHGPGYSAGNSVGRYYTLDAPVADEFHTYAVEWEPGEIRWFIDDTHYFTVNPSSLNGNAWVFDRPHFLLLNLAIDGNFAGPLDPSVEFPQQLWIDYVRVYQRDAGDADSLLNGGFELGNTNHWNGYAAGGANNAGIYVESTSSTYYNGGSPGGDPVQTRSGNFVGKIYGDFIGSENYNGCYQDITAIPNSEWQADGWAMSHPQDLMSGQNQAWIEVTFRDDEDRVLSLYRSEVMTAQELLPGQWQKLSVNTQID
ncbi:MAG: family 16 glycosylhydrolase, partial [Luteolibacter sp.]